MTNKFFFLCDLIGDYEYIFVFDHILYPIFESFNPDLVIVSAGFDSAINDPFGILIHYFIYLRR